MNKQALIEKLGGNLSLPSLPEVVVRLLEMIGDPECGMKDLGEAMCADPPMTARVLRVANSALYSLSRPIIDVRHAAAVLGLDALHTLLMQIELVELVEKFAPVKGFNPRVLWKHSVLTSRIAASFPDRLMHVNRREEMRSCALLHDIGEFVLLEEFGDSILGLVRQSLEGDQPLHLAERERYGFDHAEIGGLVADRWGLPRTAVQAIEQHHRPARELAEAPDMVAVVALADEVARRMVGAKNIRLKRPLPAELVDGLALDEDEVERLLEGSLALQRKAA